VIAGAVAAGGLVPATPDALAAHGVDIEHHFSKREYAKEMRVKAGTLIQQHEHPHDHLSILAQGAARVWVDGVSVLHAGPACLHIEAGKAHSVEAVTDIVWYCVHATDDNDPLSVDQTILKG
jgi:quercetin dioxygenase-like cupin family protein